MRPSANATVIAACLLIGCGGESDPTPPSPGTEQRPTPSEPSHEGPAHEEPAHETEPAQELPPPPPSRIEPRGPYQADVGRDCDGYPQVSLTALRDRCVGIVLHGELPEIQAARGRFRPRAVLQDPARDDVMWLVDAGARRARAGRLWRLTMRDGAWAPSVAIDHLDRPHGIRLGPDGWIYLGEVQRIVRFDPRAADPASTVERVIDDLPFAMPGRETRFHPLKAFVFTPSWDLIVNMGSSTDRCLESLPEDDRCHDEREHIAAIWRFRYQGERRWASTPDYIAHGLRNSVALVVHPSGTILQGENGVDFPEVDRPHEELNVIEEGHHYGWPYCFDREGRVPEWAQASFSCDPRVNPEYVPPRVLLPPHGAPLGMMYYRGALFPELSGKLVISLHGYRDPGHRVIAFDVDARGVPARDAAFEEVIAGWDASDRGPRGAPVEITEARDGSIWVVEDNNGTVLRLSVDRYASSRSEPSAPSADAPSIEADDAFIALQRDVLRPRCSACHDHFTSEPTEALRAMHRLGWLRADEGGETLMWSRVRPGAERRMPLNGQLTAHETESIRRWLESQR